MDKQETILKLNRILANFAVLFIKTYRYSWFLKGKHIFSIQHVCSNFQGEIDQTINQLADYILASGGKPFATMIKFLKEATIEEATADDEESEIIAQLAGDFAVIIQQIENLLRDTDEATKHFLYALLRQMKSHHYQLKAYQMKT